MEKAITNKEQALNSLGVFDRQAIAELSGHLEFIRVSPGRTLVTEGTYLPTSLVAVAGSIMVSAGSQPALVVDAPCALDSWVTDQRRIASLTAIANAETALLLIDWSFHAAAFEAIDRLGQISAQTRRSVFTPTTTLGESPVATRVG